MNNLPKIDRDQALATIHCLASANDVKLATAESLTAGLIAATLAETSGCSQYLLGGIIAYNIDQKVMMLGVNRASAESCNCVSTEVAYQMAMGVQERLGANTVIAVTGYAEPWPDGGVYDPYAFYCIFAGLRREVGIIDLQGLNRNAACNAVVDKTLFELAWLMEVAFESR